MTRTGNSKRRYAVVVGLIGSCVFLYLSFRAIDLHGLWHTLSTSHWWPWYVLAPTVYVCGHLVRGLRCRLILKPHAEISTWTGTNIGIIGYGANNILPARMGEFVRAYVLSRLTRLSVSLTLAATFLERLLDGLAITMILLVAGFFSPLPAWGRHILLLAGLIFLTAMAGVVLVMVAKAWVLRVSRRATLWLPATVAERFLSVLDRGISATDCLREGHVAASIVLLSLVVWVVEGSMFLLILPAFHLPMNPIWAAMAVSVTNLGILIPSTPGYVGPFQYFCMQALLLFGVARETALGYAIVAHLLYYLPVTVWGLVALWAYGVDPRAAAEAVPADSSAVLAAEQVAEEVRLAQ